MRSSGSMSNLLLVLFGVGVTIIRYAVFGDLSEAEWYVKVPVLLLSDTASCSALSGLFLLLAGNTGSGRMDGLYPDSSAKDYSWKAKASVAVHKGCNIATFIISVAYLVLLCIITSFDMFYIHIISSIIIFFVLKNRSMKCCEVKLFKGASLLIDEYTSKSWDRERLYLDTTKENQDLVDRYNRELDCLEDRIPMSCDISFSMNYILDFPMIDFSGLSFRLFHGYAQLLTKYTSFIESSENKNETEEKTHKAVCHVLISIRKMLMQEYSTMIIKKPEDMPDNSYIELLTMTHSLRNDVLQLMLQQREALADQFGGEFDTNIQTIINNHDDLFNNVRNCVVPILTYFQEKSQLNIKLLSQLRQKEGITNYD